MNLFEVIDDAGVLEPFQKRAPQDVFEVIDDANILGAPQGPTEPRTPIPAAPVAPTAPPLPPATPPPTPLPYIASPLGEPEQLPADYVSIDALDVQDDAGILGQVGGFTVSLGLPVAAGIMTGGASVPIQATAQGVAGLTGELARQYMSGEPIDAKTALVVGAGQAVPMGRGLGEVLGKAGTWVGTALTAAQRAIQGSGLGVVQERTRQVAAGEEGDWRKAGIAGGAGLVIGGVLGGTLESRLASAGVRKLQAEEKAAAEAAERKALAAAEAQVAKAPEKPLPGLKEEVPDVSGGLPHPSDLYEMPVEQMNVDPERFQYKRAAVLPGGVTREMQGEEAFDRGASNVVSVWMDPADGKFWVIDGHHRYAKAVNTGTKSLPVRIYTAETGVPDEGTARVTGALLNIKAGKGDAVDAAKIFRDARIEPKDLAKLGVSLDSQLVKDGLGLKKLNDALFRKVSLGDIEIARGATIGREIPDPAQQDALMQMILAHEAKYGELADKDLAELLRFVKNAPMEAQVFKEQPTLPGTAGTGGGESLAPIMAKTSTWIAKTLKGDKNTLKYIAQLKRQEILARGGNVIDAELSKQIAKGSEQMLELYMKLSVSAGPVNDLLKDAARRIAKGENPQLVNAQALDAIRKELQTQFPFLSAANIGAQAPAEPAQQEVFGPKTKASVAGGPTMAVRLKDGSIVTGQPGQIHSTILADRGINPDQVQDTGFIIRGEYTLGLGPRVDEGAGVPRAPQQEALPFEVPPKHSRVTIPPPASQRPPTTGAQAPQVPLQRRSEIIHNISDSLGVPIRTGKLGSLGNKVRGLFKGASKTIRLRRALDVPTTFHEVGHHISTLQPGWFGDAALRPYAEELLPIGTTPLRAGEEIAEGFAEFMRMYVTDPLRAAHYAPKFMRHFEGVVDKDVKEILLSGRQAYKRWNEQTDLQKILSQINMDPRPRVRNTFSQFRTYWIDNLHPLREAVRALEKASGGKILASQDTYKLARLFRGVSGKVDHYLEVGGFNPRTMGRDGSQGFEQILFPVKQNLDEFRGYLAALRAIEYEGRGLDHGMNVHGKDLEKVVSDLDQQFPQFATARAELEKYQDSLLDYLVERGVLSPGAKIRMKELNKSYVPFYRVIDHEVSGIAPGRGSSWTELFEAPRRVKKGGGQEIVDPLESILRNTYAFIYLAEANHVKRSFVQLAEKVGKQIYKQELAADWTMATGKYAERVPWPVRPVKLGGEDLLEWIRRRMPPEKFEDTGLTGQEKRLDQLVQITDIIQRELGIDIPDELILAFKPTNFIPKDAPIIPVMRGGKTYLYEVSPEVYETFADLEPQAQNDMIRFLSVPSRILRAGATLTPEFAARNPIRDQFQIFIQRRFGVTPLDFFRGAAHVLQASDTAKELRRKYPSLEKLIGDNFSDEMYRLYQRTGAQHASMVSMDRDYLQEQARALVQSQYDELVRSAKQPWHIPQDAVSMLRAISELSEEASRVGFFAKGVYKLGDDPDALLEAGFSTRESSVDFSLKGKLLYQQLNAINAFWGAKIQGLDRVAREFKEHPLAAPARAFAAYTLPAMYLYAANYNDGRVNELPQWQRDLFFIVPTAHVSKEAWGQMTAEEKQEFNDRWPIIRIPAGFETALAFKALPERMLDWIFKDDPAGMERWAEQVTNQVSPVQWPDALRPIVEAVPERGWSFFRNAPLMGRREAEGDAYLQKSPYTSKLAEITGEALNVGLEGGVSPAKIDNFIQSWGGGLGVITVDAVDGLLTMAGIADTSAPAAKQMREWPLVRAFIARFPTVQSQSVEDFYDIYDRVQKKANSFRILRDEDPEKADAYFNEHEELIALEYMMTKIAEGIGSYRKLAVAAIGDDALTPVQKQRIRDQYVMEMIGLAAEFVDAYRAQERGKTEETQAAIPEGFQPREAQVKDLFQEPGVPVPSKPPKPLGYGAPARMFLNQVLPGGW